jgi:hypothetical protein
MNWLHPTSDGCTLTVKATPRANKSEIVGPDPDWLRVRIQAPPVDGKANAALIELFSKTFDIQKRAVEILSGDTSRLKRVRLYGVSADAVISVTSHERQTV